MLRSPAGEEMAIQNNFFLEGFMFNSMMRQLSEEEMNEYRFVNIFNLALKIQIEMFEGVS